MNPPIIFYDGSCGLCHGFVRFTVARDLNRRFLYAPLQGETFRVRLPQEAQKNLPDSVVLLDDHNNLRVRSEAVIEVLRHLPGVWPIAAKILQCVPRFLRDGGYCIVAKIRRLIFKKPDDLCPLVPPDLRKLFLN